MIEIVYIFCGWILGLLGQPIVSKIEKYYRRNDLKIAIYSELKNLGVRLAAVCYKIEMHLGIRDKSTLRWVKSIYERYRVDYPKGLSEAIEKLLQSPDEQFNIATNLFKGDETIGLSLKTYSLPFSESIVEHLSIFNSKFQRDIFEIRAQISILNEEVENAMFYFRLTFDPSCMNTNKDIIRSNINNGYKEI
ncbi:MAG: hypothetical protein ISS45_03330 [Candidatus Omnitrophica bacterium]|nr:hypothetical protein [Candidatus Omnitrophota bacterium]